ncbi:hypothetical protein [Acinetobacter sp. YH12239]|uniref:hypothetical protein n=1 Tax=Acinetobacter sp. YH12239 TaxID=2601166 RepID=UPI0015D37B57|nr:hypothetical protein [Acinetobacter sp. YH12239]
MINIKEIINDAGGVSVVATALNLSERSIYKWIEKGALPRSEYTGETDYSTQIAALSTNYGRKLILQIGKPKKPKVELDTNLQTA